MILFGRKTVVASETLDVLIVKNQRFFEKHLTWEKEVESVYLFQNAQKMPTVEVPYFSLFSRNY